MYPLCVSLVIVDISLVAYPIVTPAWRPHVLASRLSHLCRTSPASERVHVCDNGPSLFSPTVLLTWHETVVLHASLHVIPVHQSVETDQQHATLAMCLHELPLRILNNPSVSGGPLYEASRAKVPRIISGRKLYKFPNRKRTRRPPEPLLLP